MGGPGNPGTVAGDRAGPRRGPHEPVEPAPPDPLLPGVRRLGLLATRRAALAEAEFSRAKRASDEAAEALAQAQQALADCIDDVAAQRSALRQACQAARGGEPVLRRWRQEDQRELDRIPAARRVVADCQREHDAAELALADAAARHRALARRREKFSLLEEQLRDGG